MRITVTGAAGYLGRAVLAGLADSHEVRAVDLRQPADLPHLERADVLDPADADRICAGAEAVVHLAAARRDPDLTPSENDARILDTRVKGTAHILRAAAEAKVRRVVQVSDLCVFSGYGPEVIVSEDFAPLPDTSAEAQSVYLAELVAREYARLHPGLVLTLRLGTLVEASRLDPGVRLCPEWLELDDAVAAIARALVVEQYDGLAHWGLYHLAADLPGGRYSLLKIRNGALAFAPREGFAAWRQEGAR